MEYSGFGSPSALTDNFCNFKQKLILNTFWNGLTLFYLMRLIFADMNFEEVMFSQTLRFFDQFIENCQQETCLTLLSAKTNLQKI